MKKLVTISLIVFGAVVAVLLIANLAPKQNQSRDQQASPLTNDPVAPATGQEVVLDMVELAKHNSLTDCWLLINSRVYDVTKYLSSHPGGIETMAQYCGREASQAFATKDKSEPKPHSSRANDMLANYYLGILGQQFNPSQKPAEPQNTDAPATNDDKEAEIETENEDN